MNRQLNCSGIVNVQGGRQIDTIRAVTLEGRIPLSSADRHLIERDREADFALFPPIRLKICCNQPNTCLDVSLSLSSFGKGLRKAYLKDILPEISRDRSRVYFLGQLDGKEEAPGMLRVLLRSAGFLAFG